MPRIMDVHLMMTRGGSANSLRHQFQKPERVAIQSALRLCICLERKWVWTRLNCKAISSYTCIQLKPFFFMSAQTPYQPKAVCIRQDWRHTFQRATFQKINQTHSDTHTLQRSEQSMATYPSEPTVGLRSLGYI